DMGVLLASEFVDDNIEVVVGPAVGSNILASYIAGALDGVNGKKVQNCWTEKGEDKKFMLRPQFIGLIDGKRVLIAEDVLTTGGSANSTIDLVKENGGRIVAVGVLCNRGGVTAETLGVPEAKLVALLNIEFETWTKEECPLCKDNILMSQIVGHAKKLKE
ncbi:MAG: phosphoribosyltransferase, partial [Candidatus Kerfeldbacteria bacterium]|nr:phosphoribosyltransferase [Candidatus Kerfeldbacteria bacterium]